MLLRIAEQKEWGLFFATVLPAATLLKIYKSCGNRHCPTCQGQKANDWLSKRLDRMLPVPHFMITYYSPGIISGVLPLTSIFCLLKSV